MEDGQRILKLELQVVSLTQDLKEADDRELFTLRHCEEYRAKQFELEQQVRELKEAIKKDGAR